MVEERGGEKEQQTSALESVCGCLKGGARDGER